MLQNLVTDYIEEYIATIGSANKSTRKNAEENLASFIETAELEEADLRRLWRLIDWYLYSCEKNNYTWTERLVFEQEVFDFVDTLERKYVI